MSGISDCYMVYVNSRDRLAGTDSNFTYSINFPPDIHPDHVTVINALIPKSYYLIQANHNMFDLQEGSTIVTIYIPIGNYFLGNFATQLSTLLTSNSPNGWVYTVTPPGGIVNTGKYTYTVTGNSSQPSIIVQDHVYEPLGFNANSINTFVNDTLISTNVLKLQSEDRLLIHSNCVNTPGTSDILVSINAATSVNFSSISYINYAPEYNAKVLNPNLNTYSFCLQNEDGRLLDLNGLNMNITLLFYKQNNAIEQIRNFLKALTEK